MPSRKPSRPEAFRIREFSPADFETLWQIDQACFPPGISYSRAELRSYIQRRAAFTLLAEPSSHQHRNTNDRDNDRDRDRDRDTNTNNGENQDANKSASPEQTSASLSQNQQPIAGFIVAEAARGRGHIITIDVVAAARRFGVGSLLLQSAEQRLLTARCRVVELETAVDNASALSFYKRHQYHVVGTAPRYYSNGVDALVLEKDLPENLAPAAPLTNSH